jgi:hypothetical protein
VHKGRKPSIDRADIEKLREEGLGATAIAKRLKIRFRGIPVASRFLARPGDGCR